MEARTQVKTASSSGALTPPQLRHLLRRLAFTPTPALERALAGRPAGDVLATLVVAARQAPQPEMPAVVRASWSNTALRAPGTTDAVFDAARAAYTRQARHDIDQVRAWWVQEMVSSAAPLREQLTLFLHGTFGCTTSAVDIPHALHGTSALLRRACLGTVPDLLEQLVVDPGMLIQIGMDEHRRVRVSDRPAKLILDYWTVGAGHYQDADVEALSRALTGWTLTTPSGTAPPAVDPAAPRQARRAGLVPAFDPSQFDARPKTLLGATGNFDARSAMRLLALHPDTARRFSGLLLAHLGVDDPGGRLQGQLAATYLETGGAVEALLQNIVASPEFWSDATRWALVKSPVHLAVAACRQLDLTAPPMDTVVPWLAACGQTLFDTPNSGEGGWPGDTAWVTPADRLAIRYQLPVVLGGVSPALGLERPRKGVARPAAPAVATDAALRREPADRVFDRLDPGPGLDRRRVTAGDGARSELIARVMRTPQYQLA